MTGGSAVRAGFLPQESRSILLPDGSAVRAERRPPRSRSMLNQSLLTPLIQTTY
jgi:hypothetical protein